MPILLTMESLISFNQIESSQKLVILGDMLELGASSEVEHQAIVDYLESKYLKAILVGKFYQKPKYLLPLKILWN